MEKNYIKVKLSSKHTKFGYYGCIVAIILTIPPALYLISDLVTDFKFNFFFALIILIAIIVGCIYCVKYLTIGEIRENKIYLKKFSKPEQTFTLKNVSKVKVYENAKDKYIILTMNRGAQIDQFLLVNWKAFYSDEIRNTETVLKEILENNKTQTS